MRIQKYKKTIAWVAIFLLGIGGLISSSVPAQAADPTRQITVNGVGTVFVTPDAVRFTFSVTKVAATSKDALSQTSTAANAVRSALKAQSIATKDIKTSSLTVYPEYNYTQDQGQVLTGYRATQSFNVVIRKADAAGDVIDAVVDAGNNAVQVNGVTPFLTNGAAATQQARAAAVADAKARAASYASLLGEKLGKVIFLTENSAPVYQFPVAAKADALASTQIDLGEEEVTVTVTIQWSLG